MGSPILGLGKHMGEGENPMVDGRVLDTLNEFVRVTKPGHEEGLRGMPRSIGRRERSGRAEETP